MKIRGIELADVLTYMPERGWPVKKAVCGHCPGPQEGALTKRACRKMTNAVLSDLKPRIDSPLMPERCNSAEKLYEQELLGRAAVISKDIIGEE